MNKNILTVMKKEFARFFGDRRLLVTALILPGLLIYVVYSFMGTALQDMYTPDATHKPVLNAVNLPQSIAAAAADPTYGFDIVNTTNPDDTRTKIENKETDILAIFPKDFDQTVADYNVSSGTPAPNIEIYYNAVNPDSSAAYGSLVALLNTYEATIANKFDVNRDVSADLATNEDVMAFSLASMLPFLLTMMMFSGCMSLAPESIAGEKERGTIATILVTPIKRSELAAGKMLSLGVLAFLCGLSSCLGLFLSLPKMMQLGDDINMNIYTVTDYVMIAMIVLTTILPIIAVISIISAFAKTVKEATTSVMPLMIVVMLVGVSSMFGGGAQTDIAYYFIPLYNSVQALSGIFSFDYAVPNIVVSVVSNIVYAGIGGFVLTRMFNSEKVIFSR
ncbi:hypothetical protein FACS1894217_11720 [Clostridia bacterium]|nr:hypothetical protein FACS1894217_11720 [Clostridia bacterium]